MLVSTSVSLSFFFLKKIFLCHSITIVFVPVGQWASGPSLQTLDLCNGGVCVEDEGWIIRRESLKINMYIVYVFHALKNTIKYV